MLERLVKELEGSGRPVVFFRARDDVARSLRRVPALRTAALRDTTLRAALAHCAAPSVTVNTDDAAASLLDHSGRDHEKV